MLRFVLVVFPFYLQNSGHTAFLPKACLLRCWASRGVVFSPSIMGWGLSLLTPGASSPTLRRAVLPTQALSHLLLLSWFPFPTRPADFMTATRPGSSSKLQHAKYRSGPGWGSFTAAGTFSSVPSAFTFTLLLRYRGRGFCSLGIFPTSYPALFSVHDFRVSKVSVSSLQAWRAPEAVYPGALLQAVSSALSPTFCSTTSFSAGFWSAAVLLYRRRHSFVHTSRITHSSELACVVAGYLQETLSFCHAQCCFSLKRRI